MLSRSSLPRLVAPLLVAAALGAAGTTAALADDSPTPAPTWGDYVVSDQGSFSVDDGVLTGELPAEVTADNIPVDPDASRAEQREDTAAIKAAVEQRDQAATTRAVTTKKHHHVSGSRATVRVRPDHPYDGCVSISAGTTPAGVNWKGTMARCHRGNLEVNTWLDRNDSQVPGTYSHTPCYGQTSCQSPSQYYGGRPGYAIYTAYVHGINNSTGNDAYVWRSFKPAG